MLTDALSLTGKRPNSKSFSTSWVPSKTPGPPERRGRDTCEILIIVAFILLFVLSSPWNLLAFAACVVLWVGELFVWNRTVRGRRAAVGTQTLIGSEAKVTAPCRPLGQVQVGGELWEARCDAGADPGETVRVTARDGLTLVVEPL